MVCELQVPIIAAGAAAFTAIDDLQQVPMQASLAWTEALDQGRHIERGFSPACEAGHRQARAARKFAAERGF